ncbi:MAG: hypothetical protein EOP51_27090 [Sphingobacteriales bacterium]|nr:MAG: hypothetical protein EOP51_27090 [Sphingobacteriales bacterium]
MVGLSSETTCTGITDVFTAATVAGFAAAGAAAGCSGVIGFAGSTFGSIVTSINLSLGPSIGGG